MDVENQKKLSLSGTPPSEKSQRKIEEKHSVKKVVISHLENCLKKLNFEANDERRSIN